MKRLLGLLSVLLCTLFVFVATGCKDEEEPLVISPPTPSYVGQVDIVMALDTLYVGGSGSTSAVAVVVYDQNGLPFPGVKVSISSPTGAHLEFADSVLQDTTNESGRIELYYWVESLGVDTIVARVDTICDVTQIVVCYFSSWSPTLHVSVLPSELDPTATDSALVIVNLQNELGIPVANALLGVSTNGGTLDELPPTDYVGNALTYWHPADTGRFWISANYLWTKPCEDQWFQDTAWVTVMPPEPGQVVILVAIDTLRFLPGDSASTPVTVILISQGGLTMPGRRVTMSLSNPSIGFLEFLDPMLRDTTNDQGRINMMLSAWGYGTIQVIAACGDISRMTPVVCMAP